jgi:hypothetical protein
MLKTLISIIQPFQILFLGARKDLEEKSFFYLKYGHDNEEYYNQKRKQRNGLKRKWE